MKTKITLKNFATSVLALVLLTGFSAMAQTYVYNQSGNSGMFIDGGSEVLNPVSDAVNSSANCAETGAGGWKKIEYFLTYTPVAGNKLYFSVYNPNNAGPGQIKFFYTSAPSTEQWGDNVTYIGASLTGWAEYSIDLANHVGKEINKILMYPAGGSSSTAYIDNIYFGSQSALPAPQTAMVYNETTSSGMFIDGGAEVTNPVSDAVNSSAKCAKTGTGGWKKVEYFPTYTPVTGAKLYFSVYNPNNAGPGQIKFFYTSAPTVEQWGDNVTYVSGSVTGWVEYSIDLSSHVGKEINKILMYPAGGSSSDAYIDNIYFGTKSSLPTPQTPMVYNETTSSGIFIDGGSEVANPVSDAVNSSANCAKSGTGGWKKTEFFPTYTPVAGNKLYFSIYNPNNVGPGQIKFFYTSAPSTEQWGGNVTYGAPSATGWVEYSLDLTDHIGKEINKILMYPAGGSNSFVYLDNVYFATNSTLSTNSFAKISNQVYVSKEGKIQFTKEQTNSQLSVFDISGRLILEEKINGFEGVKTLNNKGIYIVRVKSDQGVSSQKIIF
jgi:bacillopeptidase F (M6 metalloprotease family)